MPSLLMPIIRFVLPLQDHMIKKLLLIFWEIVPKTGQDGKLLHEMILVCDAYRRDLEHPNEFIRGSTLRFLCKLKVGAWKYTYGQWLFYMPSHIWTTLAGYLFVCIMVLETKMKYVNEIIFTKIGN